jgi:hypothetical protein
MSAVQLEPDLKQEQDRERKSVPGRGRTIYAEAEKYGLHVRRAVRILAGARQEDDIGATIAAVFPIVNCFITDATKHDEWLRAAWLLVNQWIFMRAHSSRGESLSLDSAELLFSGSCEPHNRAIAAHFSAAGIEEAQHVLERLTFDRGLRDLLPYVLDAHGPGSRASVMRDPSTETARNTRRQNGVFFTPEDVAEYMVDSLFQGKAVAEGSLPTVLDPACGTGVFLRSAMRWFVQNRGVQPSVAASSLFGCDICLQSVESCAFVLLHACAECQGSLPFAPIKAWSAIREHLAVIDSSLLECGSSLGLGTASAVGPATERLSVAEGGVVYSCLDRATEASRTTVQLGQVFPALSMGADVLVGNPPYNRLGSRGDVAALRRRFSSLSDPVRLQGAETFLLFVEMMWGLTKQDGHAGLVLPMSIAYNTGAQFRLCRRAMSAQSAEWHLAFFDREPHALFGEDVKTRNAIAFCRKGVSCSADRAAVFHFTGLNRWTSRNRHALFRDLRFTRAERVPIERYMPKLGTDEEQRIYMLLSSKLRRLGDGGVRVTSRQLAEIGEDATDRTVYVSSTAYNFLNVFRGLGPVAEADRAILSSSPAHQLEFASEDDARVAQAVLCSRLSYWLWQVIGDGFHVTRAFIENLPIDIDQLGSDAKSVLSAVGASIWEECLQRRTRNVNGGRVTFAYRPVLDSIRLTQADEVVLGQLGLAVGFAASLRRYVHDLVVINDERRMHLVR